MRCHLGEGNCIISPTSPPILLVGLLRLQPGRCRSLSPWPSCQELTSIFPAILISYLMIDNLLANLCTQVLISPTTLQGGNRTCSEGEAQTGEPSCHVHTHHCLFPALTFIDLLFLRCTCSKSINPKCIAQQMFTFVYIWVTITLSRTEHKTIQAASHCPSCRSHWRWLLFGLLTPNAGFTSCGTACNNYALFGVWLLQVNIMSLRLIDPVLCISNLLCFC
jgi:hypothetical protein